MQLKYALWALENLRFPVQIKKRPPYQAIGAIEIKFKRLVLIRNWILYSLNCINAHIMMHVLQGQGEWLDNSMEKVANLSEIVALHRQYVDTVYVQCFQTVNDSSIRGFIQQMISLVVIVQCEWDTLSAEFNGVVLIEENTDQLDSVKTDILWIESTYIDIHSHLTKILTANVYSKKEIHCKFYTIKLSVI